MELGRCRERELLKFIPKTAVDIYNNSLCIRDKSNFDIYSNWYEQEYKIPILIIEKCSNTSSWEKCATPEEIDRFLDDNIFYIVKQRTYVDGKVFLHNAEDFVNLDDPKNLEQGYAPLKKNYDTIFYETIGTTRKGK